jgi:hypothetical protein
MNSSEHTNSLYYIMTFHLRWVLVADIKYCSALCFSCLFAEVANSDAPNNCALYNCQISKWFYCVREGETRVCVRGDHRSSLTPLLKIASLLVKWPWNKARAGETVAWLKEIFVRGSHAQVSLETITFIACWIRILSLVRRQVFLSLSHHFACKMQKESAQSQRARSHTHASSRAC